MKKTIGIFGTSGMAEEMQQLAQILNYEAVLIARERKDYEKYSGNSELIVEDELYKYKLNSFSVGIGNTLIRKNIVKRHSQLNYLNLIHPDTSIDTNLSNKINEKVGIVILAGARFTTNIEIGNFSIINLNCTISHDSILKDFVTLAPQACILGNVIIEECAWIGAAATINQGTYNKKKIIGQNTTIGSGTVVLDSCDSNSTYVGSPARKIK